MTKHEQIAITVMTLLVAFPLLTYARLNTAGATYPFGGRVISVTIPTVTCVGAGTGPVVLMSNLVSLGSATYSSLSRQQPTTQKVGSVVTGVYGAIPIYTETTQKVPTTGGWVLGRHSLIPDFKKCQTTAFGAPVPFPVKNTNNYGVSRQLK